MVSTVQENLKDWVQLDDDVLIKAHLKGDRRAFEVLFKKHRDSVARLVFSIVKNETLVEDIVQEVFLLVYRYLPKFRSESSFKTWIYRISVNESIRQLNRSKRWITVAPCEMEDMSFPTALVVVSQGPNQERFLLEGDNRRLIHTALSNLKPNHRVILSLYYLEEMSIQDVAQILDIPEGSVKSRLYYARENLKKILAPTAVEPGAEKNVAHHGM